MPMISVIVPIYNAAQYVEKCVRSIINQTYKDIEIILVNDGSTDNSEEICAELAKEDNRIKLVTKTNEGVSVARNTGKELATGDYVIFVDSDDMLNPNMLKILLDNIISTDSDVSICDICRMSGEDEAVPKDEKVNCELMNREDALSLLLMGSKLYSGPWNKLFKNEIVKDIEFMPVKKMNEDRYFVFQALCVSKKIVYTNQKLYYYIVRSNSATTARFSDRWFDMVYFAEKMYTEICEKYPKLEKEARFSLVNVLYLLAKKMNRENAVREYKDEYKEITDKLRKTKTSDINYMLKNSTKIGLFFAKYATPIFAHLAKQT